jgi:hypothetical protein
MNLIIKNYEKLKQKKWDDKNFIEDIDERIDKYTISVWRDYMRHFVVLYRKPLENGYYQIGKWSNEASCIRHPYWIKHEDILDIDSLMDKLKFLTDYWKPKLL